MSAENPATEGYRLEEANYKLNDFQKLLGDIQWDRPYLSLTNKQLQPVCDILPGNTDLNSPRYLTDAARKALLLVEQRIQSAALKLQDESKQFIL